MPSYQTARFRFYFYVLGIITTCMLYSGNLMALDPDSDPDDNPLGKRVSLNTKNATFDQVLMQVTDQSGVLFSYNPSSIPTNKTWNLEVRNQTVNSVLKSILPNADYELKVVSRTVIILPGKDNPMVQNSEQKKQKYTISGLVYDRETGEKIAYATVYDIHKLKSALTDQQGSYEFQVNTREQDLQISVSKKGYWDTIIFVEPEVTENLEISLKPKPEKIAPIANRNVHELSEKSLNDLGIVRTATPERVETQQENLEGFKDERIAQASFLPGMGTNKKMDLMIENKISFNVLAGYSYGVKGFEFGGLLNMVRKDVEGFQIGGFGNVVGRQVDGIQIGGFFNHCVGKVNGIQFAGFSNTVLDTLRGIQIGGFMNVVRGKVKGVQVGGFSNVVTRSVDGAQVAGFVNVALDSAGKAQFAGFANYGKHLIGSQTAGFANINIGNGTGSQFSGFGNYNEGDFIGPQSAGFININRGKLTGTQIAGFANVNLGDAEGFMASGFVNVARKVKGSMFSVFNIADTVSGIPIGIFSLIRRGYHPVEVYYGDFTNANFTFKTGTRKFYNLISYGEGRRMGTRIWSFGYGIGHSQKIIKDRLYVDVDLSCNQVNLGNRFNPYFSLLGRGNLNVSVRVAGPVYLFGAINYNNYVFDALMPMDSEFLWGTLRTQAPQQYASQTWVGYQFGVRI